MKQIIELTPDERAEVFTQAGVELNLPPFYVEKDFWVCWTLGVLFGHEEIGGHLTFRGGTSLSKGWGLIERFSEDIDLAMAREWADEDSPNLAEVGLNTAARDRRLTQLRRACRQTIRNVVVPILEAEAAKLGDGARIEVKTLDKDRDPFVIDLHYPQGGLEVPGDYHRSVVKIELSGRADDWPQEPRSILPYAAEAFPDLGTWTPMSIACVRPARTFWEKAALLHERHTQPKNEAVVARQSRHLYDLVQLWEHVADQSGLLELFEGVKLHRRAFFNYGHVDYDRLKPGDLILAPPSEQLAQWRSDYLAMGPMFIGDPPAFDKLMASIKRIETALGHFVE